MFPSFLIKQKHGKVKPFPCLAINIEHNFCPVKGQKRAGARPVSRNNEEQMGREESREERTERSGPEIAINSSFCVFLWILCTLGKAQKVLETFRAFPDGIVFQKKAEKGVVYGYSKG
jgi:hypothetical protein